MSGPRIVLGPSDSGREADINRISVVHRPDRYHLWHTGQADGHSHIGFCDMDHAQIGLA